ncbi:hypothetical protein BUALT_Bualt03G0085200 [Buddleja alternifolia]|uniref:SnoaL-like domain-containing protein n=1 Tax=Buddleja alternifolia TaxID=168488 RepID=A0AAV6Y089_9LAMI|nr:hypothetical protein BUALT_Bualt03G0085200 [Buddleja alternifolia]
MGSISIPSATLFTNSPPFLRAVKLAHISIPKVKFHDANMSCISHVTYPQRVCIKGNGSIRIGRAGVGCGAKESGSGEEPGALETVLKLYEAMKNKNVSKISDIIAEECLCSSNFVSTFKPFHGKKQVLGFFSSLMKNMGNNIEFVVQHTYDDGMVVGVTWKLEWKKVRLPLGKGFSIHMCHVYQGKVMIKKKSKKLQLKDVSFNLWAENHQLGDECNGKAKSSGSVQEQGNKSCKDFVHSFLRGGYCLCTQTQDVHVNCMLPQLLTVNPQKGSEAIARSGPINTNQSLLISYLLISSRSKRASSSSHID